MKMIYGDAPIKSVKVHSFDVNSNDATMVASDMQAGVTAYARGKQITGTGKAFSFATYGGCSSNVTLPITVTTINTISISSADYAVQMTDIMRNLRELDFSTAKTVANVIVDSVSYPITLKVANSMITLACDKTVTLETVFGKDEYV